MQTTTKDNDLKLESNTSLAHLPSIDQEKKNKESAKILEILPDIEKSNELNDICKTNKSKNNK